MSNSSFTQTSIDFSSAERFYSSGSTCNCYRLKLYGKQHFVKRLKPELAGDPRYKSMLQKEFETGYSLEHPNLVRYIQIGDDFIMMDYVDGERLSEFMKTHNDFFKEKSNREKLINQLLSVTEYLHSHQVLHLDLKPDNIIITRIGHDLKLVDLGFSYTDMFPSTPGHTRSFAAPEQLDESGIVDERTDIFALGRIMSLIPYGNELKPIVERCTKAEPERRYQTVAEIRKALKKKRKWRWFVVSAFLLVAALLALLLIPKQSDSPSGNDNPSDTLFVSEDLNKNSLDSLTIVAADSTEKDIEQNAEIKVDPTETPTIVDIPDPVKPTAVEMTSPGKRTEQPTSTYHSQENPVVSKPSQSASQAEDSKPISPIQESDPQLLSKIIEEYKNGIRPSVIKMVDFHVSNGGVYITNSDEKNFLNDNVFYNLLDEYDEKYFKTVKTKLLNKYGNRISEIDKLELPEKFQLATIEELKRYVHQLGMSF